MPQTNSWLCLYAIAQIGRPYWYKTEGQISSESLYGNVVAPALRKDYGLSALYTNYQSELNKKVHDCSGLIVGALTCENVDGEPTLKSPVTHSAKMQFSLDCKVKSNNMSGFPKIPGTLVFKSNGSEKNHVGIYIGEFVDRTGTHFTDAVIEAKGHAYGVVTSRLDLDNKSKGGWDSWGQLKCCKIDTNENTVFNINTNPLTSDSIQQINIQTKSMKPFIATVLADSNPQLNYDKIKAVRISGMMFFGGELYDISHMKKTYINPHLDNQVKQCSNAGMPYALYVNVKSSNVIEADEECRTLYYVISQYPPSLGLWLSLQTNNSVSTNNDILEVYYKYIDKWGLRARCGLYVTPNQLSKITWNSFKDRFYLWLIDPMDISKVDDELLDPEMFEVPD